MVNLNSPMEIAMRDLTRLIDLANANLNTIPEVVNVLGNSFGAAGDGSSDDTAAFQKALSAGDYIWVPSGHTFLIGDVELDGKIILGGGTIKKKSGAESAFLVKGTGTIIDGLIFEGQQTSGQGSWDIKLADGAKDVLIRGNRFRSPVYSAIAAAREDETYQDHVKGVIITGNLFNGYARPIFLLYADHVTISDNIIRDTSYDAIRLRYNDGFVLIDNNQFYNIGVNSPDDGQTKDALDLYYSGQNVTITNNIVRVAKSLGFDIKGVSPDASNRTAKVIVANNQLYRTEFAGIVIYGDSNYDGAGSYEFAHSILVHDNICEECNYSNISGGGRMSEAGIYVRGLAKYVDIHDNILFCNYGKGLHVISGFASTAANRSVLIHHNLAVNNGVSGDTDSVGIHVSAVDGLIMTENIAELDASLPNPYQNIGIYFSSTGGYTPTKSAIIDKNIARNNLTNQILIDPNNSRANNIASFFGNIQSGTGAVHRVTWQNERSIFFGVGVPAVGDGEFRQGDIIFNVAPTVGGIDYWRCVSSGSPGTWEPVQLGVASSVSGAPAGVGFFAVVGGNLYGSVGTSGSGDWKQLS